MEHILKNGEMLARVSLQGGTVVEWKHRHTPIFCPYREESEIFAERCGCFPLVPFGNRMENGEIILDDKRYLFEKNTKDAFYLHGDGWLAPWAWVSREEHKASMVISWQGTFSYECRQDFILDSEALTMQLSLTNTGASPMLCGLGWHPYFSFYEHLALNAQCSHYWTEAPNYLPLERKTCSPRQGMVQRNWENTCFEGWDGKAEIETEHYKICLTTEPAMSYFQTFTMEHANFYCFEPMSHRTNDFRIEAGFSHLEVGETRTQCMKITLI